VIEGRVENAVPLSVSNLKKMSAVDNDMRLKSEIADATQYVLCQMKTCALNGGCEK